MHRTASALVAVGLLLAACEGSSDVGLDPPAAETATDEAAADQVPSPVDRPSPTTPAAASPGDSDVDAARPSPSVAADLDVTTTPDEVTPEWVTAVVNTLLAEYGEMTAEILAMPVQEDPTLPDGFEERLDALFDGQYLERRRQELLLFTSSEEARSDLLSPDEFGSLSITTQAVQVSTAECLVAVGRLSQVATVQSGAPLPWLSAISLSPSESGNPTRWELIDELPNTSPSGSLNDDLIMLESTLEDYGDALENTCEADS